MEQLKVLRVYVDAAYQMSKDILDLQHTGEVQDCANSLLYGKAWLGKLSGELGITNPYAATDGKLKEVKDIPPVAARVSIVKDVDNGNVTRTYLVDGEASTDETKAYLDQYFTKEDRLQKIDFLRGFIAHLAEKVKFIDRDGIEIKTREGSIARTNAYNHICEARIALGFELERIKATEV